MDSRLWRPLLTGILLTLVGCTTLVAAWIYADAAKREATAVGTLSYVSCGRSCTYEYVFQVNEARIHDDSGVCHTALTPQGCKTGASVLIYYDPQHLSRSMLEEFSAASRRRLIASIWLLSFGLLFIGFHFIFKKKRENAE